jgi:glycosyltransferase involved in cell wall biosynthesis
MSKPAIVVVAYQCGPGMGSVSQIGWEWYDRLREQYDVTLVTHIRNRAALKGANADGRIVYIDTEWFAGPLYRLSRRLFPRSEHTVFMISSLDYFLFDFFAYRTLKRLGRRGVKWQLIHRVTPVTLSAPTLLGRLGLPLIVGPLNSGLGKPQGFEAILRQESGWLIRVRNVSRVFDALIGSSRRIARILTATRATFEAVAPRYRGRCRMMVENGVNLDKFVPTAWPAAPYQARALKVLFVGRLLPLKGVDMLLAAIARLSAEGRNVELEIVGDGAMAEPWKALAAELCIDGIVRFSGALPAEQVAQRMAASHVLCLPSVRESGGAVLLEAMACARPVVALDFGGPAEIVNDEVGALLPMASPEQVVSDLTRTFDNMFDEPKVWRDRGLAGRQRIEREFSWAAKVSSARQVYADFLPQEPAHV